MRADIPSNVRRLRQARGLTQYQLGLLAGKTQQYISFVERGYIPPVRVLGPLARALNATLDDLIIEVESPRAGCR